MTLSLERRAALWGDRTAVVDADATGDDDRRVSYAELNEQAESMARALSALGVEPGDAVAVLSRNRIEVLALLFAARRLGAVLAPVSHRLTPATVAGPLDAVAPSVVVHEPAQRDLVREVADDDACDFAELARIEGEDYDSTPPAGRDSEKSFLYLHTSGEAHRPAVGSSHDAGDRPAETRTDDPQAAERVADVPERAVEWNCITAASAWGLGRDDCAPTFLPLSDADGLLRLTLPLLYVGGRVVVLRAFDPEDAVSVVDGGGIDGEGIDGEGADVGEETGVGEGATVCFAGATEYRELVAADGFDDAEFERLSWVGTRSSLPTDAREALASHAPVVRVYARVETGANLYTPPERASADPDYVGRPFPDCEVRVVADGEAVGEDGVGDLEFRGPVVARGYLDGETFDGWVSTGDVAVREGGDYYVLGRASETFDGTDERVHPRIVERALTSHEGVTEAGAVSGPDGPQAVVVGDADVVELRGFVADRLPEDVELCEIVRVESLPRGPTGEPDRAKIRQEWFDDVEQFDEAAEYDEEREFDGEGQSAGERQSDDE